MKNSIRCQLHIYVNFPSVTVSFQREKDSIDRYRKRSDGNIGEQSIGLTGYFVWNKVRRTFQ